MVSETHPSFDAAWRKLLSRLPNDLDLDQSAREQGALKRRRVVRDGATLLRLALAHGPGGMSLRSAAAWAGGCDIAQLSDVGLLKRLRGASDWLSHVAASLLTSEGPVRLGERQLRIVDGSVIRSSGKNGTDWRLHATYDSAKVSSASLASAITTAGKACRGTASRRVIWSWPIGDMPGRPDCCMCWNWGRILSLV